MITPIFYQDTLPTEKDTDSDGKIWIFRMPSGTPHDKTSYCMRISLLSYIEPLKTEIVHYVTSSKQKRTKLSYTQSSSTAYYNRIQYPYWFPGKLLKEMPKRKISSRNLSLESSNFPSFKGHLTEDDYNTIRKIYNEHATN